MRNKSYFNELHNNVNRLEKDYENFETLINARDTLIEQIGSGGNGKVFSAESTSKKITCP